MSRLRHAGLIPSPALRDGLHTPGRGLNRARRQGALLRRSLASLASLDRSARLRRQAIHSFAAQSRFFCRLLPTKAAESQRPHRVVVVTRRGGTNVEQRRRRLITTGRCGPEKFYARGSRKAGRGQPERLDEGPRDIENMRGQQQSVAAPLAPTLSPQRGARGRVARFVGAIHCSLTPCCA